MQVINCWNKISDYLQFKDQANITKVNKFLNTVKITNLCSYYYDNNNNITFLNEILTDEILIKYKNIKYLDLNGNYNVSNEGFAAAQQLLISSYLVY